MSKKKKTTLKGKFVFRRFLIIAVFVAIFGGVGWLAYTRLFIGNAARYTKDLASSSSSEVSSKAEPSSSAKPESSSKAESKPAKAEPNSEDWKLLLVNSVHSLPSGYVPELETITETYRVDKRIADNVKRMFNDARQSGITLTICSAYRSVDKQEELFAEKKQEYINRGKNEKDAIAVAATIVAKPGTSEHHTGLAMDIVTPKYTNLDAGFENTPAFKWLNKNAYKYGMVLRFPKDKQKYTGIIYEPWHYRYVGEENAKLMKAKGFCLEEYVAALKGEKVQILETPTLPADIGPSSNTEASEETTSSQKGTKSESSAESASSQKGAKSESSEESASSKKGAKSESSAESASSNESSSKKSGTKKSSSSESEPESASSSSKSAKPKAKSSSSSEESASAKQ